MQTNLVTLAASGVEIMELNLDGYTELPPGKLAAVVTYLEMTAPPQGFHVVRRDGLTLRRFPAGGDLSQYRDVYRAIGEPWLWFSRLLLSDEELRQVIEDSRVEVYLLESSGEVNGLLELDRREAPDVELAFLGVTLDLIGTGAGRYLMSKAIELAFRANPRRFWLHTCTLDHPGALSFYLRAGFRPYKRAIEVADDPRLTGIFPRSAAAGIPLL